MSFEEKEIIEQLGKLFTTIRQDLIKYIRNNIPTELKKKETIIISISTEGISIDLHNNKSGTIFCIAYFDLYEEG